MALTVEEFIEKLIFLGLEHYRKFYGIYRGAVTRNDDPEKRGRIQAHVPGALQRAAPDVWIDPAFDGAGDSRGSFWPPEVGDSVRVAFERGDPSLPVIYWGGWHGLPARLQGKSEVPPELGHLADSTTPVCRGVVTRLGHVLAFNERAGAEAVDLIWHKPEAGDKALADPKVTADRAKGKSASLRFFPNGDIVLTNQNGSKVHLDAANKKILIQDENGNKATLDNSGVHVEGVQKIDLLAGFVNLASGHDTPAVRGRDLMQWLVSHTHGTAWGPSSPPLVPPPATILSKNVTLK